MCLVHTRHIIMHQHLVDDEAADPTDWPNFHWSGVQLNTSGTTDPHAGAHL